MFFIAFLVEMNYTFKNRVKKEYIENSKWQKLIKIIDNAQKNDVKVSFLKKNDSIFRKEIEDFSLVSKRMCISTSIVKNVFNIIHDNEHQDFDRTYY